MSMHAGWMALRTLSSDQSVKHAKLKPDTLKRIIKYAKPYQSKFILFFIALVLDSVLTVATPLLLKRLIDEGVIPKNGALVTQLALLVGLIAVAYAAVNIFIRWYSAIIGEGLIYDLRSQVFQHVQSQSIAATFSGVISNVITLILVIGAMISLSWQITLLSLVLLPIFLIPTKYVGRRLAEFTQQSYELNAEMASTMTERFNVSGALLVKLYGNPAKEAKNFRGKARKVADIGINMAMLNTFFFVALISVASIATAFAYGVGGHFAIAGTMTVGSLIAITTLLARLYGPRFELM
ncbi:MAG: hypothetical protein RL534_288 [Actinomycetota bacterium]